MKYKGYIGKFIRANLTTKKISVISLDEKMAEDFLGGSGFGAKILWDEVAPQVSPLSPDNKLIIATGPLSGTLWPSCGRTEFIAKSPLTGIYGDASSGGFFAPELKFAGYDFIIIEGKSENPVYLYIEDKIIQFLDAQHLWGKGTLETQELIRKEMNDPEIKVASIGPAGENKVLFSCIMVTYNRAAARTGMGAVMLSLIHI